MRRILALALAAAQLAAAWPRPGPGIAAVGGGGDPFLALEDSPEWGTGGSVVDLTTAIPKFRPLEYDYGTVEGIPLDTTGWATVTPASCTAAAVQAAFAAVAVEETVVDLSACSEIHSTSVGGGANHLVYNYSDVRHRIVFRGNPTTRTKIIIDGVDPRTLPGSGGGISEFAFLLGTNAVAPNVATWTWTVGRELNATILGSSAPITELYPDDPVMVGIDDLPSPYNGSGRGMEARLVRRVVCSKWDDGSEHPTGCGSTYGVTLNNTFKIDRPIVADFRTAGPYKWSSLITGAYIQQLERHGGTATNGLFEYIGFENLEFEHEYKWVARDFASAVRVTTADKVWFKNVRFGAWGASKLTLNYSNSEPTTSNVLLIRSILDEEVWKPECIGTISAATTTNPVVATFDVLADCSGDGAWGELGGSSGIGDNGYNSVNPVIYIDPECPVTELRGLHSMKHDADLPDTGITEVDLVLPDVNGTTITDTTPDCWAVNLTQFGDAAVYSDVGSTGLQIIDSILQNTRVGLIIQGGWDTVVAYSYCYTQAGHHAGRCLFDHAGMGPYLWMANQSNGQYFTTMASSPAAGRGQGPHGVLAFNELLDDGTVTNDAYGGMDSSNLGYLLNEIQDQSGTATHFLTLFGNVFEGGQTAGAGSYLDDCDNGDNDSCADAIETTSGIHQVNDFRETGNLWTSFNIDAELSPYSGGDQNPTSITPESEAGDSNEGTELSVGDRGRGYPDDLFYDVEPAWFCPEASPWRSVGADKYTAGSALKIPARRRAEGLSCTQP